MSVDVDDSEVDVDDEDDGDGSSEEVDGRSVALKFNWTMVASMERVETGTAVVTADEIVVSVPDKMTNVGRVKCVVDAIALLVAFMQVTRGCVVVAGIICWHH